MNTSLGSIYTDRADMESYTFFLYSFVRGYKPDSILEIGISRGVSTTTFFNAVEEGKLENCIYHGIDIDENCKNIFDSYKNSRFGIRLLHTDISDNVAKDWNLPIDLLMINGSEYGQVYKDFYNFGSWVKPGGFVFIKGTYKGSKFPSKLDTVYRIVEDLDNLFGEEYRHITLPYSFGLTVCEKK